MSEKKSFVSRARYKKPQRIAFIVIIALISVGLVLPSMMWAFTSWWAPDDDGQAINEYLPPVERIAKLEEQVKENPGDARAWAGLAEAYYNNHQLAESIDKYKKALELEPGNSVWRTELARICFINSNYDEAIAQIEEELSKHPQNHLAYYYYGQFLAYGKADYAGAITQMEKYIELAGSGGEVPKARQMIEEWAKHTEK
ncbi:MAG: tetratricopeptide repeat protein [Bacillota bacterium]